MKKNFNLDEQGAALITVLLAIVVVTILFVTLIGIQISEMKSQTKFEVYIKESHNMVGEVNKEIFNKLEIYNESYNEDQLGYSIIKPKLCKPNEDDNIIIGCEVLEKRIKLTVKSNKENIPFEKEITLPFVKD